MQIECLADIADGRHIVQPVDIDPGPGISGFETDRIVDIRQFPIRQMNVVKVNETYLCPVHLPGAHKDEGAGTLPSDRCPVF
jgi:hypothetical protein